MRLQNSTKDAQKVAKNIHNINTQIVPEISNCKKQKVANKTNLNS